MTHIVPSLARASSRRRRLRTSPNHPASLGDIHSFHSFIAFTHARVPKRIIRARASLAVLIHSCARRRRRGARRARVRSTTTTIGRRRRRTARVNSSMDVSSCASRRVDDDDDETIRMIRMMMNLGTDEDLATTRAKTTIARGERWSWTRNERVGT